MTNKNLLQAMGRIDPKLIADAAPDVTQKKPAKKTWVKWASLAACFCLVFAVSVSLIYQIQNRPNIPNVIPGTDGDITPDLPTNSLDFSHYPVITSMYELDDYSSMIKVEVNNVLGTFCLGLGEPTVLLVEFNVIEDYYEKINPNTIITVPIAMDGTGISNESMLTDLQTFLNSADGFILYIDRLYDRQSIYAKDESKVDMSNITSLNLMVFNAIIPLKNEMVDVSTVYGLLDKYEISYYSPQKINGYSSFVADKMSVEKLEENIRSLYQWYMTPQYNATESGSADKGYD